MSNNVNYYEILGVSQGASSATIKKTFYKKARKLHPDVNEDPNAESEFKLLSEAYNVLIDPEKRHNYDLYGNSNGPFSNSSSGFGFDDFFSDLFNFARDSKRNRRGDLDIHVKKTISFQEQIKGATFSVSYNALTQCKICEGTGSQNLEAASVCTQCGGSGRVQQTARTVFGQMLVENVCPTCKGKGQFVAHPCSTCLGLGVTKESISEKLEVGPGVDLLNPLRVSEKGSYDSESMTKGDLYVHFELDVKEPFVFTQKGLAAPCEVNFFDLLCGGEIKVPTLLEEDKNTAFLEPFTPDHTLLTLQELGLARSDGKRTPLLVELIASMPSSLSEEELQQIRAIRDAHKG